MTIMKFATATAVAALLATGASAATLSLIGNPADYSNFTLPGGSGLSGVYNLSAPPTGTSISALTGDKKTASNGLFLTGQAKVVYTYLGSEAGNKNYGLSVGGAWMFNQSSAVGSKASTVQLSSGLLDFKFGTSSPASAVGVISNDGAAVPTSNDFAIGYYSDGTSWYAFFDDIAQGDRDFDDFVLKIDLAPVPIPAAGFLLLGGLGAMGAIARRRKKS